VVVVTGARRCEIEDALEVLPVTMAFNPRVETVMGSSLSTGFSIRQGATDGTLVMLADMPRLTSSNIRLVSHHFVMENGAHVVRGSHGAKLGHPVILPSTLYQAARQLVGDMGASSIVHQSRLRTRLVDLGSAAVVDISSEDDALREGAVLRA
jgi:molybdenum cofactor cytidylyltransferase